MKRRSLSLVLAATALVSGCAAAGGVPDTSDTPRRDLAERPTPLATSSHASAGDGRDRPGRAGTASAAPDGTSSRRPGSRHIPSDAPSESGAAAGTAPFDSLAELTDPARDAGLEGPPYADLRHVTLAGDGTSLRVAVVLDAALPSKTDTDETMGIGVDLYPPGHGRESDYQLFADGEPDGWFAYLDTPDGFVRYPGTFALGGNRLVFTVPWSAVGNPRIGRISAFVDWSRRSNGLTGNKASNDFAPTTGTKIYAR